MKQAQTTYLETNEAPIFTSYLKARQPRADNLTLILMHGAGQSSSQQYEPLSHMIAEAGISVVTLDFIGHGKTGGEMSSNSLTLRTKHALAVIEHWTTADTPLILCGSSMSGHTALRVAAQLGSQAKSLWLIQPAVYAKEAEDVFFGTEFTKILRTPESWRSSLALQNAATYKGKALISIGSEDQVIPWEVILELTTSLTRNTSQVRLDVFQGVGHYVPRWLPDQTKVFTQTLDYLIAT